MYFVLAAIVLSVGIIAFVAIDAGTIMIADRILGVIANGCAGFLLIYPERFRTAIRTFLLSRIEHGTAASVAGFLGGHSPDHVLGTAK